MISAFEGPVRNRSQLHAHSHTYLSQHSSATSCSTKCKYLGASSRSWNTHPLDSNGSLWRGPSIRNPDGSESEPWSSVFRANISHGFPSLETNFSILNGRCEKQPLVESVDRVAAIHTAQLLYTLPICALCSRQSSGSSWMMQLQVLGSARRILHTNEYLQ